MRTASVVVLAVLVALAAGSVIPRKPADEVLLKRQKNILQLLIRVHQHNFFEDQSEIGNTYDIEANIAKYGEDQNTIKRFLSLYKHGDLLPRGEPFSILYKKHVEEVKLLFDILYRANDFDIFYKTACWARDRINEGVFVYTLSVAIIHRADAEDIILPPIYEISPQLFTDSEVLHEGVEARLQNKPTPVLLNLNHSHIYNSEQEVAYFTEDIGLNSYNTYLNYEYPFWLDTHKYGLAAPRRGEIFYYALQQLLARYELERLSVGLPGVEHFHLNIHRPIKIGYDPDLHYQNGVEIPVRPEGLYVHSNDLISVGALVNIKNRLRNAIDSQTLIAQTAEGPKRTLFKDIDVINVLGNLVEGNADSLNRRYFKSLYLGLLSLYGHIVDPEHEYEVAPSVLEHFETQLRDPLYYRIINEILHLFQEYKNQKKSYTREEVAENGVKIENVIVDKLVTFDDEFVYDLNGAISIAKKEEASHVDIRVRRQRLNHKPYNIKVIVNSDSAEKVVVRVFLGPTYDSLGNELTLDEKRTYLVEIDRFIHELQAGNNEIVRNSRDSSVIAHEPLPTRVLLKKVEDALQGKDELLVGPEYRHCGFPERLLIPRGNRAGQPFSLYVVVSRYQGKLSSVPESYVSCGAGIGNSLYMLDDTKPYGFPFDRVIDRVDFLTPNIYRKDVTVFHKTQEEINKAT